eukprot:gb/GFBE01064971.1/.p1 GENE.gb/GFBE01064971.1/~~gb/GFBE01064971.1/.p1  ORF type:complete len:299 (+),score=53.45 gb/GFBE01064971.1/:1-897(+)
MCATGVERNPPIFFLAIRLLGKLGKYREAKNVWRDYRQLVLPGESSHDLAICYRAILEAAAQAGDVVEARRLHHEMLSNGIDDEPVLTYGLVMNACKNSRDAVAARYFLDEIELQGYEPSEVIYTAAMAAHRWATLDEIQALESEMTRRFPEPNVHFLEEHVLSIIGASINTTDLEEAVQLVSSLEHERATALVALITHARSHGCSLKRMVQRVERALKSINTPFDFTAGKGILNLGLGVARSTSGLVYVKHVEPRGWAEKMGIEAGNLIYEINHEPTVSLDVATIKSSLRARPVRLR